MRFKITEFHQYVEDLMGGTTSQMNAKEASVKLLDHRFHFISDSTVAYVDDKEVEMDTAPAMLHDEMFIPIRIILDHTDLKWEWSEAYRYLHLQDKRVVNGVAFKQFEGNDFAQAVSDNAFHLKSFSVENQTLTIKAINISGKDIHAGKSDIQPLISYGNGSHSVDSYTRPNHPPMEKVEKGAEVTKKVTMDFTVSYIISVGRELK